MEAFTGESADGPILVSMSTAATIRMQLRDLYLSESAQTQRDFESTGNGASAIAQRTALVEKILLRLWDEVISPAGGASNFALVALGGFGRRSLFPHSDVDILFLHADRSTEALLRDTIRNYCQELWDLRMKLGPTTRTLAECDQFDPQNVEFTISLIDSRYVAGDRELFQRLHDRLLPRFFAREGNYIIQQLLAFTAFGDGQGALMAGRRNASSRLSKEEFWSGDAVSQFGENVSSLSAGP